MSTFDLAKQFIASQRYQVLDEDCSDGHIAFRFQMNTIHFWANREDENFFFMTLPSLTDVTDGNIATVKEICHQVNRDAKLVKLYVLNDVVLATAEICYLAEEDFNYQMSNALRFLMTAKVMFKKLNE